MSRLLVARALTLAGGSNRLIRYVLAAMAAIALFPGTAAAQCTYSVSPTTKTINHLSQSVYFDVTTQSGCTWGPPHDPGFLTRVGAATRTGSGSIAYFAAPNATSSTRTTTFTLAGVTVTVTQAASGPMAVSLTASPPSPQPSGTAVTFTAVASGGTISQHLDYKWWLSTSGGGSWSLLQDWTYGASTRVWTPPAAGSDYFIVVNVRQSGNQSNTPEADGFIKFVATAPAADVLVRDTFTGSDGTLLSAHPPDINGAGAAWTHSGSTPPPQLAAGRVGVSAGPGHLQATINSGISDIQMGMDVRIGGSSYLPALAFRLTDADNHLVLIAYSGQLQFYRRQAGTYTLLAGQAIPAVAVGSDHRLEVRAIGPTLEGRWDGVLIVSTTSTFQQGATRHGLDWNSAYDPTTTYDNFELRFGSATAPYGGAPVSLPGTIQAENFDEGGSGVAYYDNSPGNAGGVYRSTDVDIEPTADTGGGYDVAWMRIGEWMRYSVHVTTAGTYDLTARVASDGGGATFHVEVDGFNVSGPMTVPATGGWQTWTTIQKTGISLTAGAHTVRLVIDGLSAGGYSGGLNFLAFTVAPTCTYSVSPTTTTLNAASQSAYFSLTTQAGCPWQAPAGTGFVTRTSASSGTGSAQLTYFAAANNTLTERSVPLTIAGQNVTIRQTGAGPVTRLEVQPDRLSPQVVGAQIKWTAIATGGAHPLSYKWVVFNQGSAILAQDWTPNAETFFWTPQAPSSQYQIKVWVRSPWNTSSEGDLAASHGYTVNAASAPGSITNLTLISDRPSPQVAGTAITWTATPSGGTAPYSYKWWVSDNGTESWSLLQDWTPNASARVWTPTLVRNRYWIAVWVRSAGNTTDNPEQSRYTPFAITGSSSQNEPPLVTALPDRGNLIGATVNVPIGATDVEKAPLTYGLTGQPSGVSVNATTGLISGTLAGSPGTYTVTATVSDGVHTVTQTFAWSVSGNLSSGVVVSDHFSASGPTLLATHAPDLAPEGSSWAVLEGLSPTVENGLLRAASFSGYQAAVIRSQVAEGRVGVDLVSPSTTIYGGLVFPDRTSSQMLLLMYRGDAASGLIGLYRRNGTSVQLIQQVPVVPLATNTAGRLEANFSGTQIEAMWNGAVLFTQNVTSYQPSTSHGVVWHSDDPLAQFDRFEVSFPPGAPIIVGPGDQLHEEMWNVAVAITAMDPEGATLTYSATGLPPGLVVDGATGVISGQLTSNSADIHYVIVRATAGVGSSQRSSQWSFQWLVRCPPADYVVSPMHMDLPAGGGTFFATVFASVGCPWEATSNFVQVTNGNVRYGSGETLEAQFWIGNNPSPYPQAGLLMVAEQGVVLTQRGDQGQACTFTVQSSGLDFQAAGGTGQLTFMPSDDSCQWAIAKRGSWIHLSGATTGVGAGTIGLTIDRNNGTTTRNAYVQIGSTEVPIEQPAEAGGGDDDPDDPSAVCTVSVSPPQLQIDSNGGSYSLALSAAPGCNWNIQGLQAWLSIEPRSGSGDATLTVTVPPNTATSARGQLVAINDVNVAVVQNGTADSVTLGGTITPDPVFSVIGGSLYCEFEVDTGNRNNWKWIGLYIFLDGKVIGSTQNIGPQYVLAISRNVVAAPVDRAARCVAIESPFGIPIWERSLIVPADHTLSPTATITPASSSAPTTLTCDGQLTSSGGSLSARLTFQTPAFENLLPFCERGPQASQVAVTSVLDLDAFARPGRYTCVASFTSTTLGSASRLPTATVLNPTCKCIPPLINMAQILAGRASGFRFYIDISDSARAARTNNWFTQASGWWNSELQSVGASTRIGLDGNIPIRIADLPLDVLAQFTTGSSPTLEIDPRAFTGNFTDPFMVTVMAHELGHTLGVREHSSCSESQSIMAATLSQAHAGLTDAERCYVSSEYRASNRTPQCP